MLDLGCGWGRHARLLAAQDYQVTGIDRDEAVVAEARRRAAGEPVVYLAHDMRDLDALPGTYDAVVSLWQSFGYFDEATNASVLRQIGRKLRPEGRLVLDVYHRGFFERHQGTRTLTAGDRSIVETKRMVGNRLSVNLDYVSGRAPDAFEWQLYTPGEIRALGERLGLAWVLACARFDEGQASLPSEPRMQLVLEKDAED